MRHLKKGRKLSRRKDHRKAMLSNLAASLIKNGSVQTTDAKAKEVRPFVERMVTFARRGDLHARRVVLSRLRDYLAVKKLFEDIGPRYATRFGGYTRIIKLGFRLGDNSPMSIIQFIGDERWKKTTRKTKSSRVKEKSAKASQLPDNIPKTVETKPQVTEETSQAEEKKDSKRLTGTKKQKRSSESRLEGNQAESDNPDKDEAGEKKNEEV